MEICYSPRALTQADPARIRYSLDYSGNHYTSGYIPFDEGNTAEGHGSWGELCPAYAGGYVQPYLGQGIPVGFTAKWLDIAYVGPEATATTNSTWGRMKTLYR